MSNLTKEQLEVIKHNQGNILVSASAGSGKTHTMIERLKRLIIKENISLDQVLASTFTEASASDMKEKLKKALAEVVVGKYDRELLGELTKEQIKFCSEQLLEIPTADISTMHSFCGRIIRKYFFKVGLSPDFKVLDETDAVLLKKESLDKTFKDFYEEKEEWFSLLVDRHASGRSDKGLKGMVLDAYKDCISEENPFELIEKYISVYTRENFEYFILKLKSTLDKDLTNMRDKLRFNLAMFEQASLKKGVNFTFNLLTAVEKALSEQDPYKLKGFANYKINLSFDSNLTEILKEKKQEVKQIRDKFISNITAFLKCFGESREEDFIKFNETKVHTEYFVRILNRFIENYNNLKREENALDFKDLEHFALKILDEEEVRNVIKEKYKYIFIDEYQDTNGVQEAIINKIANDNLFMVGDVKQSIYGFRGCRSEFFVQKERKMTANNESVIRLNHNFRSAQKVIDMVNSIFNYCMTEEFYGESYLKNSQLISGGLYPEEFEGRAQIHFLNKTLDEKDKKEKVEAPKLYDILKDNPNEDNENNDLATLISNIISSELTKTIYDTKLKKERKVQLGDIAIISRNKNNQYISDLVKGLIAHGIPICAEVSQNVCNYPEIKVLINALKLADCFLQDLPLASTLKSPIGNFREEDLFEMVRYFDDFGFDKKGGFVDAFNFYLEKGNNLQLKQRLIEFKNYFDNIRAIADFVGAFGVLEKLIYSSNMEAYLYAQAGGVDKVDRLRRFVSASILNGKNLTIQEFLYRIENCDEAFNLAPFPSENNVKLITAHSSKGLEYPVVIACGLECRFSSQDDYKEVMCSRDYGFALLNYNDENKTKSENALRGVLRDNLRVDRVKEEMRLFYVMLTRATYSLHLTYMGKEDSRGDEFIGTGNFVGYIPRSLPITEHLKEDLQLTRKEQEVRKVIIIKEDEQTAKKMKENFSFTYPFIEDCDLPLKASVTAVSQKDLEEGFSYSKQIFNEEDANGKIEVKKADFAINSALDKTDTESGTIAHKILENFDFTLGESLINQVNNLLDRGVLTKEEVAKVNLERIESAIKSAGLINLGGKKIYKEQPFLINIPANLIFDTSSSESVLIQGIIDLLLIDGDNAQIIDYKYSTKSKDGLINTYKSQLELYSYAVNKVLNKTITSKTLVNIFTGESVDF